MRCMGLRLALAFSYMMLVLRAIRSVLLPLLLCTIGAYTLNTNENVCIRSIGDCVHTRHLSKRSNEPERVME